MKPPIKGNSLLAAVSRAAAPPSEPAPPASSAPKRKPRPESKSEIDASAKARPGRAGTKLIGGHFDPSVARQLRLIAAEEDTTIQSLLAEALDLLFVKKGKARVSLSDMG